MAQHPKISNTDLPSDILRLFGHTVPGNLVLDDDPIESLLYGEVSTRPTPASVLDLVHLEDNLTEEFAAALTAVLANHLGDIPALQQQLPPTRFQELLNLLIHASETGSAQDDTFLDNFAGCLSDLGRAEDARALEVRARNLRLDRKEKELEQHIERNPADSEAFDQLAHFLDRQRGDNARAEAAYRKALSLTERQQGPEHPSVALSLNQLAILLRKMSRPAEAEPLLRRAIEIEMAKLPEDSPKHPHRLNNLSSVLLMQQKLEEARSLAIRAWNYKAAKHDITSCRILFMQLAIALAKAEDRSRYVGWLKTLLTGSPLNAYGNVSTTWEVSSVIESLHSTMPVGDTALLETLAAVLNGQCDLAELDKFPTWRDQSALPLEVMD
ncbi:MAG: tetratricopeptide repeat protein [Candidatus Thiodiazotropha sp.]|jgi:tetratricopeptide (TPR) repeat protein